MRGVYSGRCRTPRRSGCTTKQTKGPLQRPRCPSRLAIADWQHWKALSAFLEIMVDRYPSSVWVDTDEEVQSGSVSPLLHRSLYHVTGTLLMQPNCSWGTLWPPMRLMQLEPSAHGHSFVEGDCSRAARSSAQDLPTFVATVLSRAPDVTSVDQMTGILTSGDEGQLQSAVRCVQGFRSLSLVFN